MEAKFYDDINKFYKLTTPFLLKREVENGLLLSLLNSLKENIHRYGEEMPLLISLMEGNTIKLIALRTPPYDFLISYTDKIESIDVLVEELLKRNEKLPGVLSLNECVANLSKYLLEEGNKYCFLFTDLSNPTSNSIYLKIGYRPVIDENHYKFLPK